MRALIGWLTVFHWCMKHGNDITTHKVIYQAFWLVLVMYEENTFW
jgi:hypothetical protein